MAKNPGTYGLDIQRDYICIAQFSPPDTSVQQVAVQPIIVGGGGIGYWDAVAGELRGLRKKIRFTGVDIVCSVPCDMAVVKSLEAESDEREQYEILRWELAMNLMGRADDYVYDFYEVNPGREAYRRKYLAAAVRRESLSKLRKIVQGIKLNPYIVDIDLFALNHVFEANYRDRLAGASILVHGEHQRTKMILVSNSSYVDYSVFDFDTDVRGTDDYIGALKADVARLSSVNSDVLQGGVTVYLAGALFTDRRFAKSVVGGVPQCEILDPFRKVVCATGMDSDQLKIYSPQLAVAIGLALRGEEGN